MAHPEIVARQATPEGARLTVRFRLKVEVSVAARRAEIKSDEEIRNFVGKNGEDPDSDIVTCDSTLTIAIDAPLCPCPCARPAEDLTLAGSVEILSDQGSDIVPAEMMPQGHE